MKRFRTRNISAWIWILVASSMAHSAEADETVGSLYDSARRATVEVLVDGHLGGSGCFVDEDGLIVTAAHVIGGPERKIEVLSHLVNRQPARAIAVDLGHDLALLRVEPREGGYPVLSPAAELPSVGEDVLLYGNPVYRHGIMQRGMVARGDLTFEYQAHFVEVMQIAATVQEGSSGGPWLNRRGQLIGIQSGAVTSKSFPAGVANVSPAPAIRSLLESQRHASTPTIGLFVDELWILQPDELKRYPPGTEGVIVQQLQEDGPAARAGLQQGDLIARTDDNSIRYRDDFVRAIRSKQPGDAIRLSIISPNGTGTREVSVAIGELEVGWPDAADE